MLPAETAPLLNINIIEIRTLRKLSYREIDFYQKHINAYDNLATLLGFVHFNYLIFIDSAFQRVILILKQTTSKLCPIMNFTLF